MIVDGILKGASEILDKVVPDANERLKAENELLRLAMAQADKQADITLAAQQHKSVFVSGGRPFLIWVCGVGLAMIFIVKPTLLMMLPLFGVELEIVNAIAGFQLDTGTLLSLVTALLGLGGLRTFEKIKGVETKSIGNKIFDKLLGGNK